MIPRAAARTQIIKISERRRATARRVANTISDREEHE